MKMKRHAILIMMHKNPEQVARLVKYFPADYCVCFIHVDAKAGVSKEHFRELLDAAGDSGKQAVILDKSISGVLACWSLVEVSIELMKAAMSYEQVSNHRFDWFRLLSGQDYPLKPFTEYEAYLEQEKNEYMGLQFLQEDQHIRDKFARWRNPIPRQYAADHPRDKLGNRMRIGISHVAEVLRTKFCGSPGEYLMKHGIVPAGGPSWWTISHELVGLILQDYTEDGMITQVIKQTATPEESYVQTVFVNSPLYEGKKTWNLTIANFGRREQQITGHTHPFRKEDFDELMACGDYFARKFDISVDAEILDLIDQRIYL